MTSRRIYLALAIGLIGGCSTAHRSGGDADIAGAWHAVEIDGRPAVGPDATRRPWLSFQKDSARVTGFGGCNRLAGPYTQSGSSLTFGAMMMTRMACADGALNTQETAFAAALAATDHYAVAGDTLTLLGGTTRRARLIR